MRKDKRKFNFPPKSPQNNINDKYSLCEQNDIVVKYGQISTPSIFIVSSIDFVSKFAEKGEQESGNTTDPLKPRRIPILQEKPVENSLPYLLPRILNFNFGQKSNDS